MAVHKCTCRYVEVWNFVSRAKGRAAIGGIQEQSQHVKVGFAAHSASYTMDTKGYFTALAAGT
jgi:hypothetical protein